MVGKKHHEVELEVFERTETGKQAAKKLRRHGLIPGVVYGATLEENIYVSIPREKFLKILRTTRGGHTFFKLKIMSDGKKVAERWGILQEMQLHPATDEIIHVDFHAVSLEEEVEANIPIRLVGEPIGVKKGGILEHGITELTVRGRAIDLPDEIVVDISSLDVGDALLVKDVRPPEGIKIVTPPEETIAVVVVSRRAEAEEKAEEEEKPAEETATGGEGTIEE